MLNAEIWEVMPLFWEVIQFYVINSNFCSDYLIEKK